MVRSPIFATPSLWGIQFMMAHGWCPSRKLSKPYRLLHGLPRLSGGFGCHPLLCYGWLWGGVLLNILPSIFSSGRSATKLRAEQQEWADAVIEKLQTDRTARTQDDDVWSWDFYFEPGSRNRRNLHWDLICSLQSSRLTMDVDPFKHSVGTFLLVTRSRLGRLWNPSQGRLRAESNG